MALNTGMTTATRAVCALAVGPESEVRIRTCPTCAANCFSFRCAEPNLSVMSNRAPNLGFKFGHLPW